jgi:hypothetical protein
VHGDSRQQADSKQRHAKKAISQHSDEHLTLERLELIFKST